MDIEINSENWLTEMTGRVSNTISVGPTGLSVPNGPQRPQSAFHSDAVPDSAEHVIEAAIARFEAAKRFADGNRDNLLEQVKKRGAEIDGYETELAKLRAIKKSMGYDAKCSSD